MNASKIPAHVTAPPLVEFSRYTAQNVSNFWLGIIQRFDPANLARIPAGDLVWATRPGALQSGEVLLCDSPELRGYELIAGPANLDPYPSALPSAPTHLPALLG